jgi:hypothetical protein
MLSEKVIKAEKLTVSRTPDGGGLLNIAMKSGAVEVLLTADAWLKLEDSVRWFNPQLEKVTTANGHANGVAKANGVVVVDHEQKLGDIEVRLTNAEERLKDVEKRVARVEAV